MNGSFSNDKLARLVGQQLAAVSTGWSVGVPGALAEFHRGETAPCVSTGSSVVTAGGALRLEPADDARGIAYEMLSKQSDLWRHGIVLCLPACRQKRDERPHRDDRTRDWDSFSFLIIPRTR